jgi:hypothetical protein
MAVVIVIVIVIVIVMVDAPVIVAALCARQSLWTEDLMR